MSHRGGPKGFVQVSSAQIFTKAPPHKCIQRFIRPGPVLPSRFLTYLVTIALSFLVQVTSPSSLKWPDYVGNNFFNTLGAFTRALGPTEPLPHLLLTLSTGAQLLAALEGICPVEPICSQERAENQGRHVQLRVCLLAGNIMANGAM